MYRKIFDLNEFPHSCSISVECYLSIRFFRSKRGRNLKHKIPINCIALARIEVGELRAMRVPEILNVFSTKEFREILDFLYFNCCCRAV
jgi:hypothetical protein